ncbi:glycosyltransferase family 4 protein [Chlamydiota bacterium]
MKVLFIMYGRHNDVSINLTKSMNKKGILVDTFNVNNIVTFRCKNFKFPSLKPRNMINSVLSIVKYGKNWKNYFNRTTYAFCLMSKAVDKYIRQVKERYDIVLQWGGLFSASLNKKGSLPYILYLDHTYAISKRYPHIPGLLDPPIQDKKWEMREREIYEKADKIFTMSNFVKNSLIHDYHIPSKKIIVVGLGANVNPLLSTKRKKYDNKKILFVGIEFNRKGGEVLLDAFSIVKKVIRDATLIIVGCNLNISQEGIEVRGFVSQDKMAKIYEEVSLFVLPSIRDHSPHVLLEAMSYKLPCIATNVEAIPEIIVDGKTGIIVPAMDSMILAEKIIFILQYEEHMSRMGEEGYKRVKESFNWDLVASRMVNELKK